MNYNVLKINSIISHSNYESVIHRFHLDYPRSGNLFNSTQQSLEVSGWVLLKASVNARVVVRYMGNVSFFNLNVNRPDVIKKVLLERPENNPQLMCGFRFELSNFGGKIEVGLEINSELYWCYEITHQEVYFADTSENESLNGVLPVIYKEQDLLILTGDKFTLMSKNKGLIQSSEYLWQDKWKEFLANRGLKQSLYFSGISIIAGNASKNNYYHWVFQVFASLNFCLEHFINKDKKIRVLGPKLNNFSRQYIELLSGIDYVEVPENTLVVVEEALFSNLMWGDFSFRPLKLIGNLYDQIKLENNQPAKRIYITRGDTPLRRVSNESEVVNLLVRYGFESVSLSGMSVPDQINMFRSAEAVAGPHGAGLTNLLFSKKGTVVIELMQDNYINKCFWSIAEGRELNYTSIINPTKVNGDNKHYDEMVVDLDLLEKSLCELGKKGYL